MSDAILPLPPAGEPRNPLLLLPRKLRAPAGAVLLARAYLIREPAAFCINLDNAIKYSGLHEDDAVQVIRLLLDPHYGARHRFESDFFVDFNALAVHFIDRRRRREQTERYMTHRHAAAADPGSAAAQIVRFADATAMDREEPT